MPRRSLSTQLTRILRWLRQLTLKPRPKILMLRPLPDGISVDQWRAGCLIYGLSVEKNTIETVAVFVRTRLAADAVMLESCPVLLIQQNEDGWTVGFRVIGDATSHADARTLAASYGRVIANNNGIARRDLTPIVRAAGYARADSVHAVLVERVQ